MGGDVDRDPAAKQGWQVGHHNTQINYVGAPTDRWSAGRVWTVPARVRDFTGRNVLFAKLANMAQARPAVVAAVHGMGGVGKTTTAIEYAHRHRDAFDIAWWVPAEDPSLIPERLAQLAHVLKLTSRTDSTEAAVARLHGALAERDRWIVVFDNAEAPRPLARFIPTGPGQVLITSRNPNWHGIADTLPVDTFSRPESIRLLRRRAPALDETAADQVAEAVGDLPLMIEQAGSLIADAGLDAPTYLRLLAERADELLDRESDSAYPESVAAAWTVAFDRLAADAPTALDLLNMVAWMAPEPVPRSVLTEQPDALPEQLRTIAADPLALADCLQILRRRGMTAAPMPDALQVHRVPAALLRAHATRAGQAEVWAAAVVRLLRAVVPEDAWLPTNDQHNDARMQQLLPHVLAATDPQRALDPVPLEVAWLLSETAKYRYRRSLVNSEDDHGEILFATAAQFERAYTLRRNQLGANHPDTLTSAGHLALSLHQLHEYKKARRLNEDTLYRRRRIFGDDAPETLLTQLNLAKNLHALGELDQARTILEDTLTRCRLRAPYYEQLVVDRLVMILRELGRDEEADSLESEYRA
jgi:Tetratricopeptide repeat/NB-ARC domain